MTTTTQARAWAISRRDGQVLGFTDHDAVLTFEGISFRPDHGLSARALVQSAGLSVDNTEVEGVLSHEAITEADLMAGLWDGADLRMWQVNWANPADRRLSFRGTLGEVARSNGAFRAELRGISEALNQSRGRVYHPRCSAVLGDAACGVRLDGAAFTVPASVLRCTEGRLFRLTGDFGQAARWFDEGVLRIVSGDGKGLMAKIKADRAVSATIREIEIWSAMAAIPVPGDKVSVRAGCDKSSRSCRKKFSNFMNFRGFPHLPAEDWLVAPQSAQRRRDTQALADGEPNEFNR